MRASRVGRYILFALAIVIALGGWMALKATEKQLRRMKADRVAPPGVATRQPQLSAPRATGPMAGGPGPSGPSGAAAEESAASVPASESDARSGVPAGAIW